jgi:hypothetical protein
MTNIPPERLAGILTALRLMAPEDNFPTAEELLLLAQMCEALDIAAAQLHPLHATVTHRWCT